LWDPTLARGVCGGTRLSPLGSVLVGGVIVGVMLAYPVAAPGWKPTLGTRRGTFTMTDLLEDAGVGGVR
jgi:hypothetical protein